MGVNYYEWMNQNYDFFVFPNKNRRSAGAIKFSYICHFRFREEKTENEANWIDG